MAHGQGKHWVLVKGHKIGVRGKPEPDLDRVGFFLFLFFFFSFLNEYDNSTKSVRDQLKELSQPLKFSSTTLKFLLSKFYIR